MNKNNVLRQLGAVEESLRTWEVGSEIERDLILEKLRRLYEEVKYNTGTPDSVSTSPAATDDSCRIAEDEDQAVEDGVPEPALKKKANKGTLPEESKETFPAPEESPASLFSEEEIPVKRKINKKVLLSLYGDEPAEEAAPADEEERDPVIAVVEEELTVSYEMTDTEVSDEGGMPVIEPHLVMEQTTTISEKIGNGGDTLADVLARQSQVPDMAEKLGSGKVAELRKSIGLNDKFLMIKEIFGNDTDAYNAAVDSLEQFTNLDDAMLYIHETYSWDPNSEAVKLLVDLLTRKLS